MGRLRIEIEAGERSGAISRGEQGDVARRRHVVAKAEYLEKGENPRFVVTSLSPQAWSAQRLYKRLYCARREMGNRIKEQIRLFADRLNTETLRVNQLPLYSSSLAGTAGHDESVNRKAANS